MGPFGQTGLMELEAQNKTASEISATISSVRASKRASDADGCLKLRNANRYLKRPGLDISIGGQNIVTFKSTNQLKSHFPLLTQLETGLRFGVLTMADY